MAAWGRPESGRFGEGLWTHGNSVLARPGEEVALRGVPWEGPGRRLTPEVLEVQVVLKPDHLDRQSRAWDVFCSPGLTGLCVQVPG